MIGRTNAGLGGGCQLGYDVVCQTAEPAKKEGRIWVKSSVAMTGVEWSNNPWSGGAVGRVDIMGTLGGSNPTSTNNVIDVFNTKVSGIWHRMKMTPSRCQQVQGSTGNWVDVDAYVCHNNTWVYLWNGTLFENGNIYKEYTGGWPVTMGVLQSTDPYLYYNAGGQKLIFGTKNKINITNYSKLCVIGRGRGDYANNGGVSARTPSFGIATAFSSSGAGSITYAARGSLSVGYVGIDSLPNFNTVSTLDITNYSGEYYIGFSVSDSHTNAEIALKKVWLE